jgi:hypothetical protein
MRDTMSSSYTIWCDLMVMALTWYSLADHILSNNAFTDDLMWTKLDAIVLCWLTNMITAHLQEAIRARGHPACHLWLTLEIQFFGNHETCTLLLDAAFHNFVQGDLSMIEYCHKFKGVADALGDLGLPIDDRILVLNILCGLNQRFKHLGAIIQRSSPFPNILKVHDDLLPEEIHLDTTGPSAAPMAFYTSTAPLAPKPQRSASFGPPNSNNNRRIGGNGGKNNSSGGKSGNTIAASSGSTNPI